MNRADERGVWVTSAQVRLTGCPDVARFLAQCLYWSQCETVVNRQGWFYKSRNEWMAETWLSRYKQEKARKVLRDMGLLTERPERRNNGIRLWFWLDQVLLNRLLNELADAAETVESSEPLYDSTLTTCVTDLSHNSAIPCVSVDSDYCGTIEPYKHYSAKFGTIVSDNIPVFNNIYRDIYKREEESKEEQNKTDVQINSRLERKSTAANPLQSCEAATFRHNGSIDENLDHGTVVETSVSEVVEKETVVETSVSQLRIEQPEVAYPVAASHDRKGFATVLFRSGQLKTTTTKNEQQEEVARLKALSPEAEKAALDGLINKALVEYNQQHPLINQPALHLDKQVFKNCHPFVYQFVNFMNRNPESSEAKSFNGFDNETGLNLLKNWIDTHGHQVIAWYQKNTPLKLEPLSGDDIALAVMVSNSRL